MGGLHEPQFTEETLRLREKEPQVLGPRHASLRPKAFPHSGPTLDPPEARDKGLNSFPPTVF